MIKSKLETILDRLRRREQPTDHSYLVVDSKDDPFADPSPGDESPDFMPEFPAADPDERAFIDATERMLVFINESEVFHGVAKFQLDQGVSVVRGYRTILKAHLSQPWKNYKERVTRYRHGFGAYPAHEPETVLAARGDVRVALTNLYNRADYEERSYVRSGDPLPNSLKQFFDDWLQAVRTLEKLDDEFIGRHTATTNQHFPRLTVSPFDVPEPET